MVTNTTDDQNEILGQLHKEIHDSLHAHKDESYGIGEHVPTQGTFIGVRVPVIRKLVEDFRKKYPQLTLDTARQLLDRFCQERGREEILFATFLMTHFRRQFDSSLWGHISRWIECIDNWETCDQMAMNIAGEVVARDLSLVDNLIVWTQSPNRWHRRFAVAATTVLNQKGRSYPQETFCVCEPLMADPEPMVQKAVSWAIRQVCKKDESAAFKFLQGNKHRTHPRILREAGTKLTPEHQAVLFG